MKKKFSMVSLLKKIAPVLLLSVFLLPAPARSEIKAKSVELSPFIGYNFFEKGQNLRDRPVFGGRLGYNFTEHFGLEVAGEFIGTGVDNASTAFTKEGQFTSPIDGVDITMYHLNLLYHFMSEKKFNPFITAGYGVAHYSPPINDKNMSVINFGVGAKYWVANNIALRLDLRDNMVYDEQINNIAATLGVVFRFGGVKKAVVVKDTTRPVVTFTSPDNGDKDVHVNHKVNVSFSKDMDPETLTPATFTIMQGKTRVSGTVTSVASNATFTPTRDFEKGATYSATITTGARDLSDNSLEHNYEWGFTTGLISDTTAPTVIFTSPANGATAAPVNQKVNVAFSERMDPTTLTATTFTLKQGTTPVSGTVTSLASNAAFTPAQKFEKGKAYTATITTGARDRAGNAMARDYVWNFTALTVPKVVAVLATLQDSHFDFNSAVISENGKTILNNNTKALKDDPKMKIHISGYTSASGTVEYNQKLSERRAEAVKHYLVTTGGIDGSRITAVGYGESHPAQYEANPSDKLSPEALANMRVIVEVIEE